MSETPVKEEISLSKERVFNLFRDTEIYKTPFRFALETFHRNLYNKIPIRSPSLELGISNGVSSCYIFSDRGNIDWGSDMPSTGEFNSNTLESHGAMSSPHTKHYRNRIGADGQNIPFSDNSFATIICNEVLGQGIDRLKMLSEMVRVLSPGGTIAFTENTNEISKFPALLERVEQFNPFRGETVGETWYLEKLKLMKMKDIWHCNFMESSSGVPLLYLLFSAKLQSPEIDSVETPLYQIFLESLMSQIEKELSAPKKTINGLHLFVSATKPGELKNLPSPKPECPECHKSKFTITTDSWVCKNPACQSIYRLENDIPMLVVNNFQDRQEFNS